MQCTLAQQAKLQISGKLPKTFLEGLLYVLFRGNHETSRKKNCAHGIDVLGSRQGSWLMRIAKIQNRYGVKGYAGGYNWCTRYIEFKNDRKVAEAGLEFLKLMDADIKIEPRPTIFLTKNETTEAEVCWGGKSACKKRIILAPGGGFAEKCWGDHNFTQLTNLLLKNKIIKFVLSDQKKIKKESHSIKHPI